MSDKPTRAALPNQFLHSALSILFGSIALYLSVQLLRSMVGVFIGVGIAVVVIGVCLALWRLRRRLHEAGDSW